MALTAATYSANAIITALVNGDILAGIKEVDIYDVGSDADVLRVDTDTKQDTLSMTQDDADETEILNEHGDNLTTIYTSKSPKFAMTFARIKNAALTEFGLVDPVTFGAAEQGLAVYASPSPVSKRLVIHFQSNENIWLEFPNVSFIAKTNSDALRTNAWGVMLKGTAHPDTVGLTVGAVTKYPVAYLHGPGSVGA